MEAALRLRLLGLAPFVLMFLGCLGGAPVGDTAGTEVPDCGADALVLGSEGAFTHETIDFEFEWSNDVGVSVGPMVTIAVPGDTSSIAATVEARGEETGFALVALDDKTFIDAARPDETDGAWWSAPYYHWGELGGTVVLPITPGTTPDGECLVLQPASLSDLEGRNGTLHLVSRRFDPGQGQVDLNIVIVGDTDLYQEELDAALERMDDVWTGDGGPRVGQVNLFSTQGSGFIRYNDSNELRATPIGVASGQAMNIFIIQDYSDEPGTLGEAGGIPGPVGLFEMDGAGVIVAVDGHIWGSDLDTQTMGETLAHEVGHQMGLFHTTEDDGSRTESLQDTPACPASADDGDGYFSAEECSDYDGGNFMFWVAGNLAQDQLSESQAMVLSRSPITQ